LVAKVIAKRGTYKIYTLALSNPIKNSDSFVWLRLESKLIIK